jgi:hypothetical protein
MEKTFPNSTLEWQGENLSGHKRPATSRLRQTSIKIDVVGC